MFSSFSPENQAKDLQKPSSMGELVCQLGFHVGDLHGKKDKLSLKPRSYILPLA